MGLLQLWVIFLTFNFISNLAHSHKRLLVSIWVVLSCGSQMDITMTSEWARWRLKSPASRLFTQPFIRVQIKENIKAPRHWPLCGEFTGPHKWPVTRKMFPFHDVIMMSCDFCTSVVVVVDALSHFKVGMCLSCVNICEKEHDVH